MILNPYPLAFTLSLGIGVIAAVIGLGGGFFYVPTLSLIFGFDQKMAIGTSLAIMITTSLSASFWYRRQGKILYKIAAILIPPSILFSMIGSYITFFIDSRILVAIFCVVLTLVSVEMLIPRFRFLTDIRIGPSFLLTTNVLTQGLQPITRIYYSHLLAWGSLGGLVSGITGTSGGAILVPALATAGIPVHYAVATSMFTIIAIGTTGAVTHATMGQISLPFVVVYGTGAAIGASVGAFAAARISPDNIKKFFGIMLLFIAIIMFVERFM
jgi:uncharacterized membrane protein YfcA